MLLLLLLLLQQPARPVVDEMRVHVYTVQICEAAAQHPDCRRHVRLQQLPRALQVVGCDDERGRGGNAAAAGETRQQAA